MKLGDLAGIVTALGALIGGIEKLVETLKRHDIPVPAEVHADITEARDAHDQLVAQVVAPPHP